MIYSILRSGQYVKDSPPLIWSCKTLILLCVNVYVSDVSVYEVSTAPKRRESARNKSMQVTHCDLLLYNGGSELKNIYIKKLDVSSTGLVYFYIANYSVKMYG